MEQKRIPIGESISLGWKITKENLWFLVGVAAIVGFFSWIPSYINEKIGQNAGSIIISTVFYLINTFIAIGTIRIALNLLDKKKAAYSDLLSDDKTFINYVLGSILYGLIVLAGFILLIVPGIIWGIKYQFYGYLIIDKKMAPVEALKKSAEMTSGLKLELLVFDLALVAIILLGFLVVFVGALVAIPITWLAAAFVYRYLASGISADKKAE